MSEKHKQFRGTSKPRQSYDRKVRHVGYTSYVALGKVIPNDWQYVRLTPLNRSPNSVELLIEKLFGAKNNAQTTNTNKTDKQNT